MNELLQKIQPHLNAERLSGNLTSLFCETLRWGASQRMALRAMLFSVRSLDVVRIIEGVGEEAAASAASTEL